VLFDDKYELLHDRINLQDVEPITESEYFVRGTTALLDAIGRTISTVKNSQKRATKDERAKRVLFVITTDGMENASREYRLSKVKAMIGECKKKYGWEFLFIGANIDAIETAGRFGIDSDRAVNYRHDSKGTAVMYDSIERAACCFRRESPLSDDWKSELERDNKNRHR
jgi:hypothetical protein